MELFFLNSLVRLLFSNTVSFRKQICSISLFIVIDEFLSQYNREDLFVHYQVLIAPVTNFLCIIKVS